MNIGLVDVDGHNFPNFALMRLSAYYKREGHRVEWAEPDMILPAGFPKLWKTAG